MAKRTKENSRSYTRSDQPTSASPFASLVDLRDQLPPGQEAEGAVSVSASSSATFAPKVVLSRQRKGHGGKTVTVLSGVLLSDQPRAQFMRELGKALGTNVRDDGVDIIMAGDQRERAKAWLEGRGAKRVVTSG